MNAKRAVCVCICLLSALFTATSRAEQDPMQLPSLTVYGYTAQAVGVTAEEDGSLTILDPAPFQLQGILRSGFGTVLNLDLFFAGDSLNLNADGNSQLDDLLATVRYLREPLDLELQATMHTDQADQRHQALAERRLEFVKNKLTLASRSKLKIETAGVKLNSIESSNKQFSVDQFSLRIRNTTLEPVVSNDY